MKGYEQKCSSVVSLVTLSFDNCTRPRTIILTQIVGSYGCKHKKAE